MTRRLHCWRPRGGTLPPPTPRARAGGGTALVHLRPKGCNYWDSSLHCLRSVLDLDRWASGTAGTTVWTTCSKGSSSTGPTRHVLRGRLRVGGWGLAIEDFAPTNQPTNQPAQPASPAHSVGLSVGLSVGPLACKFAVVHCIPLPR